MAFQADLSPCTQLPVEGDDAIVSVGWLESGSDFRTGPIEADVYERLKVLCNDPWQPFVTCGLHECTLCQFEEIRGSTNVFVPGDGAVFVCPELILHYISAHWYLPPEQFCEAVRRCPDQHTMEYRRRLLQNGGRQLLQAMPGTRNHSELRDV